MLLQAFNTILVPSILRTNLRIDWLQLGIVERCSHSRRDRCLEREDDFLSLACEIEQLDVQLDLGKTVDELEGFNSAEGVTEEEGESVHPF